MTDYVHVVVESPNPRTEDRRAFPEHAYDEARECADEKQSRTLILDIPVEEVPEGGEDD